MSAAPRAAPRGASAAGPTVPQREAGAGVALPWATQGCP